MKAYNHLKVTSSQKEKERDYFPWKRQDEFKSGKTCDRRMYAATK